MNIDTFLIVCFVLLLVGIIVTFVCFFGFYRRRPVAGKQNAAPQMKIRPQEKADIPVQRPPVQPAPVPAPSPVLILRIRRQDDNSVFNIDLSHGPVTLGRLSGCTDSDYCCVASMGDVSKRHCFLKTDESGRIIITDNGSTNHTYVNGRRIDRPAVLNPGDRFSLGQNCVFNVIGMQ